MELRLRDGRYAVSPAGVLETVQGTDETLQRVLQRLTARRGAFWPDPDYGSRLYTLSRLKPAQRAAAAGEFVTEALAGETDVTVENVSYVPGANGSAAVRVALTVDGRSAEMTVEV